MGQRSKHQSGRSKQTAAQLSWLVICSSWFVNIFVSRFQTQRHRFRRETEKSHNACSQGKKATFKERRLISSTLELMLTSVFCFRKCVFFFKLTTATSDVNSHALTSCTASQVRERDLWTEKAASRSSSRWTIFSLFYALFGIQASQLCLKPLYNFAASSSQTALMQTIKNFYFKSLFIFHL